METWKLFLHKFVRKLIIKLPNVDTFKKFKILKKMFGILKK